MTAQRPTEESCLLYFCEKKKEKQKPQRATKPKKRPKSWPKNPMPPSCWPARTYLHRLLWLPADAKKSSHRHPEKINRTKVESYILPLIS